MNDRKPQICFKIIQCQGISEIEMKKDCQCIDNLGEW